MNGLDAILNRIISDAEEKVLEIREQTQARRNEILQAADEEAECLMDAVRQQAREEVDALEQRIQSSAALESRKRILAARQALIDEAIAQAEASLGQLSERDKAELYARLLVENASGSETVIFPSGEQDFGRRAVEAVNRARGWNLTLADAPGGFRSGVVLRQGLIESNLSTELLVRSMRPELVSLAARTLFGS